MTELLMNNACKVSPPKKTKHYVSNVLNLRWQSRLFADDSIIDQLALMIRMQQNSQKPHLW